MTPTAYVAPWAFAGGLLRRDVRIDVGADGCVTSLGGANDEGEATLRRSFGNALVLPGLVNAHSHAFQRSIRGQTHQRMSGENSFWSWRKAMYEAAGALDPDALYTITKAAFSEMLRSGITHVGEFHYVHHQADGTVYDDPNELSWSVVRAARDVGIRLTLLEVFYARAGAGRPPLPEQRRFCDGSVDKYLQRVDALRTAGVDVGITPHSIRAASAPEIRALVAYAQAHDLVVHTHLSEQPRENEECLAEHGTTPAGVFELCGALERPHTFTAVHATHLRDDDFERLGTQSVCACPSTEADLGDGILNAARLQAAGTALALGSDSNAVIDLIQEARFLEMHDRLSQRARCRLNDESGALGPVLATAATFGGAQALGSTTGALRVGDPFDAVVIDLEHPFFAHVPPEHALDALFSAGTAAAVRQVVVGGREML
ncbi:MAG: formimidoylglutamate deiminase [Nannocystaceae bacterium]|nr:formimidoylglutamate deiminase [Nannocystaceae bacterium]